jgi:hypothetical protein
MIARKSLLLVGLVSSTFLATGTDAGAAPRPFTAADDVGLALFEYGGQGAPGGVVKPSPDDCYIAVVTERGRLDLSAPEDTLRVFRVADVQQRFVRHPETGAPIGPPLAQMATDKGGPLIEHVRWLPDSSGIAACSLIQSAAR